MCIINIFLFNVCYKNNEKMFNLKYLKKSCNNLNTKKRSIGVE